MAQARAAYLRLVGPSNRDTKKLNALTSSTGAWSLASIRLWARRARNDLHREAIGLRTTLWPLPNITVVAGREADGDAAMIPDLTVLAGDTTQASADQDWATVTKASEKPAAAGEQMREVLGLPSAS